MQTNVGYMQHALLCYVVRTCTPKNNFDAFGPSGICIYLGCIVPGNKCIRFFLCTSLQFANAGQIEYIPIIGMGRK